MFQIKLQNNKQRFAQTCFRGGFAHTPTLRKVKLVCGFTLVEMMVAIAVFSVVMVTAIGALINVIDANSKARALKTAINNVSFALEAISKDMRMGTEYACGSDGNTSRGDCTDGVDTISFRSSKVDANYIYYKYSRVDNIGRIESCLSDSGTGLCLSGYSPLTSAEVNLTSVKFYILGANDNTKQPRLILTLSGEAGAKEKIKTTFDLQTGVSQRIRPEKI